MTKLKFCFMIASPLGFVSKCTLTGKVHNLKINGHQYCVVDKEKRKHSEAVEICKNLNARLPLPRDQAEAHAFMSLKGFTSGKFHNVWMNADARNPIKTSNKSEWVDAEGKPLGNRAVNLRVIILFFNSANLSTMTTDPIQSGSMGSR